MGLEKNLPEAVKSAMLWTQFKWGASVTAVDPLD